MSEFTGTLDGLIDRIKNKDKEALADIYHMTSESVYGFALSILKSTHDAEDVLHDTYLNIYSKAGTYNSLQKPMAWILTITRNLSLMRLRDSKKTTDLDCFPELIYRQEVTAEDRIVLNACMNKLTDEERQIIILHSVSGFKHWEIADILELKLSTVLSKYRRALKKLRVLLREESFNEE